MVVDPNQVCIAINGLVWEPFSLSWIVYRDGGSHTFTQDSYSFITVVATGYLFDGITFAKAADVARRSVSSLGPPV